MPRHSVQLLVVLSAASFLTCFVLMIGTGWLLELPVFAPPASAAVTPTARSAPTQAPKPDLPAVPVTPGPQKSLLVVGVDDAAASNPVLEGCWVVTFRPGVPEYYALGFAPSATLMSASLSAAMPLTDIFAQDRQYQLNFRLLRDAVHDRFPGLDVVGVLVLDRSDFLTVAGLAGGLSLDGRVVTPADLLAAYDALPTADYAPRMVFQDRLFGLLFAALGERGWTAEALAQELASSAHLSSSTAASLEVFTQNAPPLAGSTLYWRTYVPELEISTAP